ncbi:hypothetical protein LINPERHAP2_LOCUS33839 [Linum perenne]
MAMVKVSRCSSGLPVPSYALMVGGTNPCGGGTMSNSLSSGWRMAICLGPDWWCGKNSLIISSESAIPLACLELVGRSALLVVWAISILIITAISAFCFCNSAICPARSVFWAGEGVETTVTMLASATGVCEAPAPERLNKKSCVSWLKGVSPC